MEAEISVTHRSRPGVAAALGRAVMGAVTMAVALGAGTAAGSHVATAWGLSGWVMRLVPALLCCGIAVAVVVGLRTRWDRRSLRGLGLTPARRSAGAFLLGVAVTGGSAGLVLAAGTAAGWLRWGPLDVADLVIFVATNAVVAMLLEALPEELTLRGYAWTSLHETRGAWLATVVTTGLFLTVSGLSTVVHAGATLVLSGKASPIGIAPPGEDPVAYLILLTVFGLTLAAARVATPSLSLWTCIGTHLTFLTVNRATLLGAKRGSGWNVDLVTPDAVLLVPGYLIVAALVYLVLARRAKTRRETKPMSRLRAPSLDAGGAE